MGKPIIIEERIEMSKFQHLELLSRGPVTTVRLLSCRPYSVGELVELTNEWNSIADRADCQTLLVDCSNVQLLSSEMLSKLILLQRRLKLKKARLLLSGLRTEVREILSWTRLDRFFEIYEDEEREAAALA